MLGQPRATFVGARKNCHKIPEGRASFGRPEEKNIKITSKSPPAGPAFAKTHVFLSFSRVAHPAPYTNAGGNKSENRALAWRRAAKFLWAWRDERAKSADGEKNCVFCARLREAILIVIYTEHMKCLRENRKNGARRCKKGPVFSNHYSRTRRTFESEQSAFFLVCQRKSVKKPDTRCPAESEKREEKHVNKKLCPQKSFAITRSKRDDAKRAREQIAVV